MVGMEDATSRVEKVLGRILKKGAGVKEEVGRLGGWGGRWRVVDRAGR
jgi:hypothetical protein